MQPSSNRAKPVAVERLESRHLMAAVVHALAPTTNLVTGRPVDVNGTVFFTAPSDATGVELWKTNGTAAGTTIVKDILPGTLSSNISGLTNVNGTLFFTAQDGQGGRALYRSDGTAAGTQPVVRMTNIHSLFAAPDGILYFVGEGGASGSGIYKTNGTAGGTAFVRNVASVGKMHAFNGIIYFYGYLPGANVGVELMRTDGTFAGTYMVKDIHPGAGNSLPLNFMTAGGKLYFAAQATNDGVELWTTDGTADGTRMVKDVIPGALGSFMKPALVIGNTLYSVTGQYNYTQELWKTDGPTGTTTLVARISDQSANSYTMHLTNLNGSIIFGAYQTARGMELWKSNGTAGGTGFYAETRAGTGDGYLFGATPIALNGYVFYRGTEGASGAELWATDGTAGGTSRVADLNAGAGNADPSDLLISGGRLYFVAADSAGRRTLYVASVTPPPPSGAISGTLFNDVNANGLNDTGDGKLASWKVFLDADKDGVLDTGERTATTDLSGNFKFTGLAAGSYRVREVLNSAWRRTTPSSGYFDLTLASGQSVTGRNFGNTQKALISGTLWNDTDGDGVKDSGEVGLANWRVFLDADKDGVFDSVEKSVLTRSNGTYSFDTLAPGSYRIRAVQPTGWRRTTSGSYYDTTLGSGASSTNKNFGFTQRVLISGNVFNDLDGDKIKDSLETGLASWRVYIDADGDGVFDTGERSVLSDSSGNWSFKDLAAGSYKVRVVQPTGWTRTTPTAGYFAVTLSSGGSSLNRLFGYRRTV